jgi:multidrug efflux pump subunit AcrB
VISKFFIEHPVLANVLAIVLIIIGGVSLMRLPTAQYPNITPPTIQVTTRYPGASPQTVVDTVALPIELPVNGVPGMIYMESTSAYARVSLGLSVLSGIIASTCLAVLFVPAFFVTLQHLDEARQARDQAKTLKPAGAETAE